MNISAIYSIQIDSKSQLALYKQLQEQIEELIAKGRLVENEKVPSSRALAKILDISRTSTLRALDNLVAEGILVAKPKKGLFVAKNQPLKELPVQSYSKTTGVLQTQSKHLQAVFSSGADISLFPRKVWAKCMRAGWLHADDLVLQGAYESGLPLLKIQICEYLQSLRGLVCKPEQIIISSGNRDSLSIISHALQTKSAYIECPTYPQIKSLFELLANNVYPVSIDEQGACLSDDIKDTVLLTPCRQFPSGVQMSSTRRQAWLDFLAVRANKSSKVYVIEDDYDNEFSFKRRSSVPLMQQDSSDSVIYVGSFAKVLFKGLRLSFIVCPMPLINKLQASQIALGMANNTAMQPALAEFIAGGHFASHVRKMQQSYAKKRKILLSEMKQLKHFIKLSTSEGGMHLCVYLHPKYAHLETKIVDNAKAEALTLVTISSHYFTECRQNPFDKHGFILGFTQAPEKELYQNIELFAKVLTTTCLSAS